jgi:hypothetical protein
VRPSGGSSGFDVLAAARDAKNIGVAARDTINEDVSVDWKASAAGA